MRALGLALWMLAVAGVRAEEPKYGISSTTLDNGMDVIVIENHSLPLVTAEIVVKNGAYTEPPEFDGLSHLYEHMFFKANANIPNQERYMERLRELGAQWNGTTSAEMVNYFMTVHKKNLREGTAFLRDALLYPLFKEDEMKREWPVVLGEFDRNEANPSFHLNRELERRLWYKYYSRKNTIGDREVIFNATTEQMREIQRRYYVPNNSALLVAGDAEPEAVFAMAEELFGDWQRADDPHKKWPVPEHPPLKETERIVVTGPVRTATIEIAWQGPGAKEDTEATYAADVLSYILAQPDSNFHKNLVDTGLVDAAGLSYYTLVHKGPISLMAVTSPERFDKAWDAINAEIDKFDDRDYITDEQIENAKNMLEINEIYGRERTSEYAHSVAFWWATAGLDYYLNYIDNLRKVNRRDLNDYVKKYIQSEPRIEAALVAPDVVEQLAFAKSAEVIQPKSGSSEVAFRETSAKSEAASPEATTVKPEETEEQSNATTEEFEVDGLEVVLRHNPDTEIVVAQMILRGGLPFYGIENAGRELVILETLDKGSERFSKEEVNRQLARTGGTLFTEARQDYSVFGLQTLRRDLEENFALFADAIANPLLDENEVALAVERRLNAIRAQEQSPDAYISILSSRNFYKGHPYEAPPSGTEEAINDVNAGVLQKIHDATFTRSRLKLFLYGDLSKEEATELVRENMKGLPEGDCEPKRIMREAGPPRLLVEQRDLPTNYIFGAFDAPQIGSEDYPAFVVAISILSDRLFQEVRTKRNLTYAVAAQASSRLANYAVLYVTAVKPAETIEVMFNEVQRMIDEKPPEKDLKDKIEEMITEDLIANQAGQSQLSKLVMYETAGPGWEAEAEAIEKLRQVTPEDVQAAAKKYFKGFNFAVLGNPEAIDEKLFTSR